VGEHNFVFDVYAGKVIWCVTLIWSIIDKGKWKWDV